MLFKTGDDIDSKHYCLTEYRWKGAQKSMP